MKTIPILIGAAVALLPALSWSAMERGGSIPFESVSGAALESRSIPAGNRVFRDAASFDEFWARFGSGAAPAIDFDERTVAGVFLGERPNPGYGVRVVEVRREGEGAEVVYQEILPRPGGMYAQVIVHPFAMVSFPKVEGDVRFTAGEPAATK